MSRSVAKNKSASSVALTPAGLGALILIVPGVMLGSVAREPALLAIVFGTVLSMVVNWVWSWRVLRQVRVSAGYQGVATVGERQAVKVSIDGVRGSDIELRVHPESNRRWDAAVLPGLGTVSIQPLTRGVFTSVDGGLRTSFPLGLVWQRQRCIVELETPLHVAPAKRPTNISTSPVEHTSPYGMPSEAFSGLRRYMVGDLRRDIHWKSVARTGNLMVKDRSRVGESQRIHIVIDVAHKPENEADVDELLGQCRTAAEAFLAHGHTVTMTSVELVGDGTGRTTTISERVGSYDEIGQRLARVCDARSPKAISSPDDSVLRVSGEGLNWGGPSA